MWPRDKRVVDLRRQPISAIGEDLDALHTRQVGVRVDVRPAPAPSSLRRPRKATVVIQNGSQGIFRLQWQPTGQHSVVADPWAAVAVTVP